MRLGFANRRSAIGKQGYMLLAVLPILCSLLLLRDHDSRIRCSRKKMNNVSVSEKLLFEIWRRQLFTNNGIFNVIYPGNPNTDSGPDFTNAVIITKTGVLLRGDIELHVRSSDWHAHEHDHNPDYNSVILHVVMWDNSKTPTKLQNGKTVQTISLSNYIDYPVDKIQHLINAPFFTHEQCHDTVTMLGENHTKTIISKAGLKRFRLKSLSFEDKLKKQDASQVLYTGIMRALGYSKNCDPFEELSYMLPYNRITRYISTHRSISAIPLITSLLLGSAGLLPSQQQCNLTKESTTALSELDYIWNDLGYSCPALKSKWRFFRVRPDNYPTRRIIALAYLLDRYREHGLLNGVIQLVQDTDCKNIPGTLLRGFTVDTYDSNLAKSALIGQGRAKEIVVNVILPFALAWSRISADRALYTHVFDLYMHFPRLDENHLTRRMKRLLWKCSIPDSALLQQGLIHIHTAFCTDHSCNQCPLGQNHSLTLA